jgi:predicted AlkP superfamily phosphohydrolase/phosphomutase
MPRVLIVGLDSVPPLLAFKRYRHVMPHLSQLMDAGCYGPLRSTTPPITVPAWACMFSGYDPGELGLYGFRNRVPGSYGLQLVTSTDIRRPMLWDRLGPDQRACVLYAPPSFPPRAVHGELVSCFLTPDADSVHTFPEVLGAELREHFGAYQPDVDSYRTDDLPHLLKQLYAGTEQRFSIAEYLLRTRRPDLTALVEIGPDRFHHAFWSHIDPDHPKYVPHNPYENAGLDYYRFLDRQLGRVLEAAGSDTAVLVVSDHGVRPLLGSIHINQWLIDHGYLVLSEYPSELTPFSQLAVDWRRTRAYGEGGYYARITLNVLGREPHGTVRESEVEPLCHQLKQELSCLPGPCGEVLQHQVVTPRECYRQTQGTPPDLMLFFGDLDYRSSGAVGAHTLYSPTNDTGPDACNHDWDGIFVMSGPTVAARGARDGLQNCDVAVTVLGLLGLPAADLVGVDLRGIA